MILFLAGGFHFSSKEENERELAEYLLKQHGEYNRLATFFYEKDANIIIKVVKKLNNGGNL